MRLTSRGAGGNRTPVHQALTNVLRPSPTLRLTLSHRRVGWPGGPRIVFPTGQRSFSPSAVFPAVILRFCCRAAVDRPRAPLLVRRHRRLTSDILPGMSWFRKQQKHGSAPKAPVADESTSEQAVLIFISSFTDPAADLAGIEDALIERIESAGVGEFDGNEVGPEHATLFMYGPDADALWSAVEPVVRQAPLGAGCFVVKRYGDPGA